MKYWILGFLLIAQVLTAAVARKDVPEQDRWNVEALYASSDQWQQEFNALIPTTSSPLFPHLALYKGQLDKSAQHLYETLTASITIERKLVKLGVYAHLRHCEDLADTEAKSMHERITTIMHQYAQESAWITPEILSLPEDTLQQYIDDQQLSDYRFLIQKLVKQKPHTLSSAEEEMIALAMSSLDTPRRTYLSLHNADFTFGTVLDSEGKAHELTHATYLQLLQSQDRLLRKNAFKAKGNKYLEFENTLTELFAGTVRAHHFVAQAKQYNSCLEASLSPNNIDVQVYYSLIDAVRARVNLLHRYIALRKKVLGVDELHGYDLYVPLVKNDGKKYTYEEAQKLVIECVKPLGKEYQAHLQNGLLNERWVDPYENQNKRSGAFSSGCYDSMPYILMNMSGTLKDVITLAHEAGHSMHTLHSIRSQPFHYSDYSLFVAEVASTFNEELLRHMLLQRANGANEKAYIINQALDDIRGTIFRQVMFAEFELFAHNAVEQNIPLTPKLLKDKYIELNHFYFGPEVYIDPELALEWGRVPHFHTNFYVYQYATGISAALCLADGVLHGESGAVERYLAFLRAGSSDYPLNVLAYAGCDMRSTAPVNKALDTFEAYLDQLEKLLGL